MNSEPQKNGMTNDKIELSRKFPVVRNLDQHYRKKDRETDAVTYTVSSLLKSFLPWMVYQLVEESLLAGHLDSGSPAFHSYS